MPRDLISLRWSGPRPDGVARSNFTNLAAHPLLPLTLRQELYENGNSTGEHQHQDFFALYAVRGGRGVHRIDGQPYGITRGDVYLMPAGATHEYLDYRQLEVVAFYFQLSIFTGEELSILRALPGFWNLFTGDSDQEHRFHLSPEAFKVVEKQIEDLNGEWTEATPVGDLLLRAGLFRLLVTLARQMGARPAAHSHPSKSATPGIAAAIRFCEEHFREPLSVPQLATRFFLSPGHFTELFSREVGMPPAAYLRQLRLEYARSLLRETQLSATQIALQAGFGDAAHFSRVFKAVYGVAPLQYRKQC